MSQQDPTAEDRKQDHIALAFDSVVSGRDDRFYYEPILSGFPKEGRMPVSIVGREMAFPLWISSMTGGTEHAKHINQNLAKAAQEYGLGMGLGSCRQLLYDNARMPDFAVRELMPDQPLIANLGIAQIEELIENGQVSKIVDLIEKLQADGLFVHINPLQEWMQPEGDRYHRSPLECIELLLQVSDVPILVKEVGQGMGPQSLEALLRLPLEAIEFGAHGGTNFSQLELMRTDEDRRSLYAPVTRLGHSADEMIEMVCEISSRISNEIQTKHLIVSGGVKSFIDGYYGVKKIPQSTLYAQASPFLKYAMQGYEELCNYIEIQLEGLRMCEAFLSVK